MYYRLFCDIIMNNGEVRIKYLSRIVLMYCDLESAAAGTVGQRAAWPHKNY